MSNTDAIRTHLHANPGFHRPAEVAKALGLETKQVSSALSRLLKADKVVKEDGAFADPVQADVPVLDLSRAEQPEEEPEDADEDLIGEVDPEPTPEPEKPSKPTDLKHVEVREFHGNYSIAMIPFTEAIVAAFDGVEVRSENVTGSLTRRAVISSDRRTELNSLLETLDAKVAQVFPALKVWQKEHREERRGLTDMQKYVQHRKFITDFAGHVAADLTA